MSATRSGGRARRALGLVGRLGLLGAGVTAAAQAGHHLDNWLRGVGEQATSTTGRLAGVTAELKSLDIAGAIGKASAAPKTFEELGGVLRGFLEGMYEWQTRLTSQFVGGTGAGNALQTHMLEQNGFQGTGKLDEQTSLHAGARRKRKARPRASSIRTYVPGRHPRP